MGVPEGGTAVQCHTHHFELQDGDGELGFLWWPCSLFCREYGTTTSWTRAGLASNCQVWDVCDLGEANCNRYSPLFRVRVLIHWEGLVDLVFQVLHQKEEMNFGLEVKVWVERWGALCFCKMVEASEEAGYETFSCGRKFPLVPIGSPEEAVDEMRSDPLALISPDWLICGPICAGTLYNLSVLSIHMGDTFGSMHILYNVFSIFFYICQNNMFLIFVNTLFSTRDYSGTFKVL